MNVLGVNSYSSSAYVKGNLKQKLSQFSLDLFGGKGKKFTVKNPKTIEHIKWIGKHISSPENRLILGVTALMSQPFIDAANKKVDDETRRVSICRTIAKIIAGTSTGVTIRYLCIKGIDACSKNPATLSNTAKLKKLRSLFYPTLKHSAEEFAQYKNALGTLLALGVMVFTNFLIDAPLTKALTNVFMKKKGAENEQSK